jgi:hypothetical protein
VRPGRTFSHDTQVNERLEIQSMMMESAGRVVVAPGRIAVAVVVSLQGAEQSAGYELLSESGKRMHLLLFGSTLG